MPRYVINIVYPNKYSELCKNYDLQLIKKKEDKVFSLENFCTKQIVMELPVEHGLLLDNLLDLAHAPFTHTSTFAKGWSVPRFVKTKLI